jgi:hypothetical protein
MFVRSAMPEIVSTIETIFAERSASSRIATVTSRPAVLNAS